MNATEVKSLIAVEYSVLFNCFRTRTFDELIKNNMDDLCANIPPRYAVVYFAETQERADFIITQIKRSMDPELLNKEMEEFNAHTKQEAGLSELTYEELIKQING